MADLADAVADELAGSTGPTPTTTAPTPRSWSPSSRRSTATYAEGLAECERDVVVVSHDAFGYLARYGLHLEPIAGLTPDAEPTPAALAELADLIRGRGHHDRLLRAAGQPGHGRDPGLRPRRRRPRCSTRSRGSPTRPPSEDYLSLMRANLAALQEANGC